ncbi:hypothetical protein ES705_49532 [subsurface metagenome]
MFCQELREKYYWRAVAQQEREPPSHWHTCGITTRDLPARTDAMTHAQHRGGGKKGAERGKSRVQAVGQAT